MSPASEATSTTISTARRAVQTVCAALDTKQSLELPEVKRARAAAFLITASEGAELHLERLKSRAADFDPAVRDRLIAGTMIPAVWVQRAHRVRAWFRREVSRVFETTEFW